MQNIDHIFFKVFLLELLYYIFLSLLSFANFCTLIVTREKSCSDTVWTWLLTLLLKLLNMILIEFRQNLVKLSFHLPYIIILVLLHFVWKFFILLVTLVKLFLIFEFSLIHKLLQYLIPWLIIWFKLVKKISCHIISGFRANFTYILRHNDIILKLKKLNFI